MVKYRVRVSVTQRHTLTQRFTEYLVDKIQQSQRMMQSCVHEVWLASAEWQSYSQGFLAF